MELCLFDRFFSDKIEDTLEFFHFVLSMSVATLTDILAPFEIWEVPLGYSTIKFFRPLVLTPVPLPDDPEEPSKPGENDYVLIERPDLNISVFANTRDDLEEIVLSNIRLNWTEYVCEKDQKLAPRAKSIKEAYLAIAEVVDG